MDFFNVHDQTKYSITISRPETIEQLNDWFISEEELEELIGRRVYAKAKPVTYKLKESVRAEVKKWAEKLDASGKKTLLIDDDELLEVLKEGYMADYAPDYGRHGNRICFARRYKRVKKRATQGDARTLWIHIFPVAFRNKFGCYSPHVAVYDRNVTLFKAFKKILGWKAVRASISNTENVKFYRQIWDNPEEFM